MSEGRRHPGMEHWLPLFHDRLDTLFDYVPGAPVVLEPLAEDAARERLGADRRLLRGAQGRARRARAAPPYKPLPPDRLYLAEKRMGASGSSTAALARLTPFAVPEQGGAIVDVGARQGRNFAAERAENAANVFDAVTRHVQALQAAGKRVVVALWSEGARERMSHVLADHGLANLSPVSAPGRRRWRCRSRRSRSPCSASRAGFETARRRRHRRAGHPRRPPGAAAPRRASARRISSPR